MVRLSAREVEAVRHIARLLRRTRVRAEARHLFVLWDLQDRLTKEGQDYRTGRT